MLDTMSDDLIVKQLQVLEQHLKTCEEHERDQTRKLILCYKRELGQRDNYVGNSTIDDYISDLVSDFLYYDRKEDEGLPLGEIEKAVKEGKLTVNFMVESFKKHLEKGLEI